MERMTVEEILEVTHGGLLQGDAKSVIPGISIDSRTLKKGELFLALRGDKYDGHDFVEEAFRKGARGAIVSSELRLGDCNLQVIIRVPDSLKALQDIAHHYRGKFNVPLIAITGTNGKTTTKDMVAAILGKKLNVLKTEGSFNNQVGVPLTLLRLSPSHQAAVLEMGMNAPGEIAHLARLIEPRVGAITNVGRAHLEFFKSIEEIAQAKAELVKALGEKETLVLNRDDHRVWALHSRVKGRLISFGIEKEADFQAGRIRVLTDGSTEFILSVSDGDKESLKIELPIPGYANIYNALAAAAISVTLDIGMDLIKNGLESFKPSPMRMEVVSLGRVRIINDSYNANPESMKMALELLAGLRVRGRKVAVLGDMLELGKWSEETHREMGRSVASSSPDVLVTVGEFSRWVAKEAGKAGLRGKIFTFRDSQEAGRGLAEMVKEGDTILVKGSRAMHMEEVVNVLSSLS